MGIPQFSVSNRDQFPRQDEADFQPLPVAQVLAGPRPQPSAVPPGAQTSSGPASEAAEAVERELARARAEAARLLQQAREQAAAEAENLKAQVEAQVRAEQEEAFAKAAEELLAQERRQWEELRERLAQQVAPLAIEIAERILRSTLAEKPEVVVEMARAALSSLADDGQVRLVVSPEDEDLLSQHKTALLAALPPGAELTIVSEETLGRGDLVVQGAAGELDARIDTQLNSFVEELQRASMTPETEQQQKRAA
ncbi:MAG: hypothetical protein J7M26_06185 [Armatimonadetes bacterium]|nr:hypothetical protein [Armatimonadota bacterium]